MADDRLEEILAWINEPGAKAQRTEHGSVLVRDVVAALWVKVMALEKRLAKIEDE